MVLLGALEIFIFLGSTRLGIFQIQKVPVLRGRQLYWGGFLRGHHTIAVGGGAIGCPREMISEN
jgi:hypothetical protein